MQPLNLVVVIAQACTDVVIDAAGAVVPSKRKLCATGQEGAIICANADIVEAAANTIRVAALQHVHEQSVERTVRVG